MSPQQIPALVDPEAENGHLSEARSFDPPTAPLPSILTNMTIGKAGAAKLQDVQVMYFDVFGTVVDYVDTVTKALRKEIAATTMDDPDLLSKFKTSYDWRYFTVMWRQEYKNETQRLAAIGNPDKVTVDQMHLAALNRLLAELPTAKSSKGFPVKEASQALQQAWTSDVRDRLNFIWHLLEPWSDSVEGLQLLKQQYKIGTLTNGNLNLMVDMARHGRLPWDFMLTADVLGTFKPDPSMYRKGMQLFDINPDVDGHKACMVAAHVSLVSCHQRIRFVPQRSSRTHSHPPSLSLCSIALRSAGGKSVRYDHRLRLFKADGRSASPGRQTRVR